MAMVTTEIVFEIIVSPFLVFFPFCTLPINVFNSHWPNEPKITSLTLIRRRKWTVRLTWCIINFISKQTQWMYRFQGDLLPCPLTQINSRSTTVVQYLCCGPDLAFHYTKRSFSTVRVHSHCRKSKTTASEKIQPLLFDNMFATLKLEFIVTKMFSDTVSRCYTRGESEDHTGEKACKVLRDPPWLWNPGQTSPEPQNRGISGPTRRT